MKRIHIIIVFLVIVAFIAYEKSRTGPVATAIIEQVLTPEMEQVLHDNCKSLSEKMAKCDIYLCRTSDTENPGERIIHSISGHTEDGACYYSQNMSSSGIYSCFFSEKTIKLLAKKFSLQENRGRSISDDLLSTEEFQKECSIAE